MADNLEILSSNTKFIETDFQKYPFILQADKDEGDGAENLSNIFANIKYISENKKSENLNKNDININKIKDRYIEFNYKQRDYSIYKNPIEFQFFYETKPAIIVYLPDQLKNVLLELQRYYYFQINKKIFSSDSIMDLENKNELKEPIILIPFILVIFDRFYQKINLSNSLDKGKDYYFKIEKEVLEPFSLYIEKQEILKKIRYEYMKNYNNNILNKELYYIMNDKRRNFIEKLNDYIKVDVQTHPLMLIGNDGVGKSLTLQLYTLLEYQGFKKFYFNLKLLEKCNPRDYFLIELMRGFISRDKKDQINDFKNYINCVNKFQEKDFSSVKSFFEVLNEVLNYLKYSGKYVIILDQFNFEKITVEDFNEFKRKMPNYDNYKIIICCSLNDDKNKLNMLSDYEFLNLNISNPQRKVSVKENNDNDDIIIFKNKIEKSEVNLNNVYLIKKRKRDNTKKNKETSEEIENNNKKIKERSEDIEDGNKIKLKNSGIKEEKNNKNDGIELEENNNNNEKLISSVNEKKENQIPELPSLKLNNFDVYFPINFDSIKVNISEKKLKIYYSDLITLESIFDDKKEKKEIIDCMSNFNFLPKYYSKFINFMTIKNLEGENNISNIIKLFFKEQYNKIKDNIEKFYSKMKLENTLNINTNLYQNLLKMKNVIGKTYENSIDFRKLYKYILRFPFKYINIQIQNEKDDIIFDDSLKQKKFKLRYSFPFVEKSLENIIKEYNNGDKVDIQDLSGSAYGNAIEIKIRDSLDNFKEKIDKRKVWSLYSISEAVKKEKLAELKKPNSINADRYKNLEDITGIIDIKNSDCDSFYFKPENQDNKLIDSIFLIKNKIDDYSLIALQITKNRKKNKVKDKEEYSFFLINKVKPKFETLYNINITKMYFTYILCNETLKNESLCQILTESKIKYLFYSIKKRCFYSKRDDEKIINTRNFMFNDSLIFPKDNKLYSDHDIAPFNPIPLSIKSFEETLYDAYIKDKTIFFETIRNKLFNNNFGPKIPIKLKDNIIKSLKAFVPYSNDYKILFLFAFPYEELSNFKEHKDKEELIYLFKINGKIFMLFKEESFIIDINKNVLEKCSYPIIDESKIKKEVKYNKSEIDLYSIQELYDNSIIYLFKIYYLGETLIKK